MSKTLVSRSELGNLLTEREIDNLTRIYYRTGGIPARLLLDDSVKNTTANARHLFIHMPKDRKSQPFDTLTAENWTL